VRGIVHVNLKCRLAMTALAPDGHTGAIIAGGKRGAEKKFLHKKLSSQLAPFNSERYAGDILVMLSDMERNEGIIFPCKPNESFAVSDNERVAFLFLTKLEVRSASSSSPTYAFATLYAVVPLRLGFKTSGQCARFETNVKIDLILLQHVRSIHYNFRISSL